jgi:CRISPR type III-A-associated RAMP protein Csm4
MNPGLAVKLRPFGPWRSGPDSGARDRVDPIYHSDSLYAAVTSAMFALGMRDEWLDATARAPDGPVVRFSSCFPFLGELRFIVPPLSIWPPQGGALVSATKVRWKAARFIPLSLVGTLLGGQPLSEEDWTVDGLSECLLPAGRPGPFRTSLRWSAAVDRLTGFTERHATACMEFRRDAGLWAIVSFENAAAHERWAGPVRGAFRLLADSGFGGERSRGWGRCDEPEFVEDTLPQMIWGGLVETAPRETQNGETPPPVEPGTTAHWLLSLFTPGAGDAVDWKRGHYSLIARGGRVESAARFGERKKELRMVTEGSVLVAGETLRGAAPDVAPDGFAHPVFRSGLALSVALPGQATP